MGTGFAVATNKNNYGKAFLDGFLPVLGLLIAGILLLTFVVIFVGVAITIGMSTLPILGWLTFAFEVAVTVGLVNVFFTTDLPERIKQVFRMS